MRRPRSRKCFLRRRPAVGTPQGGNRPRRRMLWSDNLHVSSLRSRGGGVSSHACRQEAKIAMCAIFGTGSARGGHRCTARRPGSWPKAPAPATEVAAPVQHRHWQQAVRKQLRRFGNLHLPMKTVRCFLLYLQGRLQGVGAGSLLPPANALASVDDRGQSARSGMASRA